MYKKIVSSSLMAGALLAMNGCGSDTIEDIKDAIDGEENITTSTGYFIDAPVKGLGYGTPSGEKGTTDALGAFKFKSGEKVSIYLGKVKLGEAVPGERGLLTPEMLTNGNEEQKNLLLRVIQGLDTDNNPENGITLPESILSDVGEASFEGMSEESILLLSAAVTSKLDANGDGFIDVGESDAIAHFEGSMEDWLSGGDGISDGGIPEVTPPETTPPPEVTPPEPTPPPEVIPPSSNVAFTNGNLQWEDGPGIAGNLVSYENRNTYCSAVTIGGNTDWRLPTVAEFMELNSVKADLAFAWNEENYIYWTADEATSAGSDYISMYNLSQGGSVLFGVSDIFSDWNIRCVRTIEAEGTPPPASDISYTTTFSDIFQGYNTRLASFAVVGDASFQTLYYFVESGTFRIQGDSTQVTGDAVVPPGLDFENIQEGELFLTLKQGDYVIYELYFLGEYKMGNNFVHVVKPGGERYGMNFPRSEAFALSHRAVGNLDDFRTEAFTDFDGIEDMYRTLFSK